MTTIRHSTKKPAASTKSTHASDDVTGAATPAPAPAPVATSSPPANPVPIVFVVQPPPAIVLPTVPATFTPVDIAYYVGILPKEAQLTVMAGAVQELKDFTDYVAVFGKTAPPQAAVLQAFDIAYQWSSTRAKLDTFDVFSASQEALSWNEVHRIMGQLHVAFGLAVKSDAEIGTTHPSLVRLFGAQSEIAQRSATTKKANKKLEAEGKLPIKGKVGKRRKSVAAKALFDAANNTAAASAPATASSAPASAPATAGSAATGSPNNGTSHS